MDFTKFLGKSEEVVLPYLGGDFVETGTRRLRVDGSISPGYFLFRVAGRKATPVSPADAIDLSDREARVGHFIHGFIALSDGSFHRLHLVPVEEPEALSPVRARVWHDGSVIYVESPFESEPEEAARRLMEQGLPLREQKGIGASLRSAFAIGLAFSVGRRLGIEVSPFEVRGAISAIAESGTAAAEVELRRIEARRIEHAQTVSQALRSERLAEFAAQSLLRRSGTSETLENAEDRAIHALVAAGGRFLSSRRLAHNQLEVRYELYGERFITVVEAISLNVVDAGVCLNHSDREVTLESLPSVIREAIDSEQLVITRR